MRRPPEAGELYCHLRIEDRAQGLYQEYYKSRDKFARSRAAELKKAGFWVKVEQAGYVENYRAYMTRLFISLGTEGITWEKLPAVYTARVETIEEPVL